MFLRCQLHLEEGDKPEDCRVMIGGKELTVHGLPDSQGEPGDGLADLPIKSGQSLADADDAKRAADKKAAAAAKKEDKKPA